MATLVFNSCIADVAKGNIDFDTDTFYVMVCNGFAASKSLHSKRSDVLNEIAASGNYTSGGSSTTVTVTKNDSLNTITVAFSNKIWTGVTTSFDSAVIYKHRGGAASADELVLYLDFGGTQSVSNGEITITFLTPLTFSNPN